MKILEKVKHLARNKFVIIGLILIGFLIYNNIVMSKIHDVENYSQDLESEINRLESSVSNGTDDAEWSIDEIRSLAEENESAISSLETKTRNIESDINTLEYQNRSNESDISTLERKVRTLEYNY
jgi:archaellum component FlaC